MYTVHKKQGMHFRVQYFVFRCTTKEKLGFKVIVLNLNILWHVWERSKITKILKSKENSECLIKWQNISNEWTTTLITLLLCVYIFVYL